MQAAVHAAPDCPNLIPAVLKALREESSDATAFAKMAEHVSHCSSCRGRLARLARFAQKLTAASAHFSSEQQQSRRRHRRMPTNEAVNIVMDDASVMLARMTEVSVGGARLETPEPLPADLQFVLNRGRKSTRAVVRHCSSAGELYSVGIEYIRN